MKIAFLVPDNREHHRRYEVTEPYFGTAPEALLEGLKQISEVEVHVITCTQRPMRSPGKLAENLFFYSLLVPKIGWLRTGYQGCVRAIRRKLRDLQPDIVHGQGTERESAISAVCSGFPNVITLHGNMRLVAKVNRARPFSYLWCAALLERFTLPRTDGVVCITSYTREAVAPLARHTWVLPNAVEGSLFSVQPKPARPPRLLCIASICHRKNQNFFIHSIDALASELPFELHFIGDVESSDEYGREFLQLIAARPWCRHGGFVSRGELRELLASSSLVVLPSLEDNCPMAVLEAAAASIAVAAADVGGVSDLVKDGVTGLLFDPRDAIGMAAAVRRLLTDSGFATQLAARAHAEARVRFDPTVIARRHVEIYREVLALRGERS